MEKEEIRIGLSYYNGRGEVRKVLDIGKQCCGLACSRKPNEWLEYEVEKNGTRKNKTVGERHKVIISAFAKWAKGTLD